MKKILLIPLLSFFIDAGIIKNEHAEISIIGYDNVINEVGIVQLGYKFKFTSGWHTYWTNPGDSGGPPLFNYENNKNLDVQENLWPAPEKIPYPPLMTYGYKNEVVFPFTVNIKDLEDNETKINVEYLVCDEICIPESATLSLILRNKILNVEIEKPLLDKWQERVPIRAPPEIIISQISNEINITSYSLKADSYFFPDNDRILDFSAAQILNGNNLSISLKDNFNGAFKGVLKAGNNFYDIDETFEVESATLANTQISFFTAILFAFLGGLILNLMPCVLPVVALKAFSLIKNSDSSRLSITLNAFSYVFGVLFTFMGIAGLLLFLKSSGEFIGWGYQLQSPQVVAVLSTIIFVIGLVLITDINLGASLMKLENINSSTNLVSSFLTGTLSVIVASPCTAPFMGAALGYALFQTDIEALLIFFFLALGFALPYFLIAIFPSLAKALPKPGAWMEQLKQFFAFLMFGAAIWLLWVLSNQVTSNSLLSVMISWLVASFLIWLAGINLQKQLKTLFVVLVGGLTLLIVDFDLKERESIQLTSSETWSKEQVAVLRENKKPYFINFTAAWCITCQVNEGIALTPRVIAEMEKKSITYLKADWTNRNREILDELKLFNRTGIPVYIFWREGLEYPIILNEVLTEQYLMEIFNEI